MKQAGTETPDLASRLARAFYTNEITTPLDNEIPRNLAAAEVIQDAMIANLGLIGGWKLGATTLAARTKLGLSQPFFGAVPASRIVCSGSVIEVPLGAMGVEPEYAFRFGRDIVGDINDENFFEAVSSVHPAFEIPASRLGSIGRHGGYALIADNGASGWIVVGEGQKIDCEFDFTASVVSLSIDGAERDRGNASAIEGMPWRVLANFVHTALLRGHKVRAGQYVVTGSCTAYAHMRSGVSAHAKFDTLGEVSVVLRNRLSHET
jgi:2-keto-4-pentenoate hydratase